MALVSWLFNAAELGRGLEGPLLVDLLVDIYESCDQHTTLLLKYLNLRALDTTRAYPRGPRTQEHVRATHRAGAVPVKIEICQVVETPTSVTKPLHVNSIQRECRCAPVLDERSSLCQMFQYIGRIGASP